MKIQNCFFNINHPKNGFIFGGYREGEVFFSGTSEYPTTDSRWRGASYYSKEDQAVYLDLLQDAVKIHGKFFD